MRLGLRCIVQFSPYADGRDEAKLIAATSQALRNLDCRSSIGPLIKILAEGGLSPVKARHWADRLSPWGEVPTAFLSCPTAKVCDGKGKVS